MAEVRVERARRVAPLTKTEARLSHMFLSSCDLVCRTYPFINRIFFYDDVPNGHELAVVIKRLELGLAQTLVVFYPLAGRLSHDEDGRLHIECTDEGAELLEASIDSPFSHFLQDGFQYRPLFWNLAPKSNLLHSDFPHEPLLSIQVTSFSNGGLTIGVSMSHIVADAQSFYDFMRCWAETCRNVSMSLPPKHMRTALSMKVLFSGDAQSCKAHENGKTPMVEIQEQEEEHRRPRSDLVQKVFSFNVEMLQRLKEKANAGRAIAIGGSNGVGVISKKGEDLCAPGIEMPLNKSESIRAGSCGGTMIPFTTFEAFCAHWWQSIIRARSLAPENPVSLAIPINCRQRFLDLPKSYFGNSLDCGHVKMTAGDLCGEELQGIASRIHEAIVAATEERFKQYIKEAEGEKNAIHHFHRTQLFHIMDSPKFAIYDTDFGFGTPKAIRAEGLRYGCEVQILAGPLGRGSFDFFCALDSESMHRLEHDPTFLSC